MARVSIGQAAANALAAWLREALASDIVVNARWPQPDVELPRKAVTVLKVGVPTREDVSCLSVGKRTNVDATHDRTAFQFGGLTQALQLDVWATNDFDRDDIIAQLDEALCAGIGKTLGLPGDPVRDGVLVPFLAADGFDGNVDCCFEAAEIDDDPTSKQRKEFRALYRGEAQFALSSTVTTPRMKSLTLKQTVHTKTGNPDDVQPDLITIPKT